MSQLRGYQVHDGEPAEHAILVFAYTARDAKRMGWAVMRCYDAEEFVQMRATWLRDCIPSEWGVSEPKVIDMLEVCHRCEYWYGEPLNDEGYCEQCYCDEEDEREYAEKEELLAEAGKVIASLGVPAKEAVESVATAFRAWVEH